VAGVDLNLTRRTLINSPAREAVLNRAVQIAGGFGVDTINRLKQDLIASIVPQDGGDPISRRELRERIVKTLEVSEARAEAIARTETTAAYNTGRVSTYKQSELVTHVRFLAITDSRVTDICASRNGLVIPIEESGEYAPPLHVNCRSVLTPLMASVSDRHRQMLEDERRNPANRNLVALPPGWR
jgi:SPP1 gp7 family putative phage head morphogenesis protein